MEDYFKELNLPFLAVSAMDGTNIEEMFYKMGKMLLDREKPKSESKFNFRRRNGCC